MSYRSLNGNGRGGGGGANAALSSGSEYLSFSPAPYYNGNTNTVINLATSISGETNKIPLIDSDGNVSAIKFTNLGTLNSILPSTEVGKPGSVLANDSYGYSYSRHHMVIGSMSNTHPYNSNPNIGFSMSNTVRGSSYTISNPDWGDFHCYDNSNQISFIRYSFDTQDVILNKLITTSISSSSANINFNAKTLTNIATISCTGLTSATSTLNFNARTLSNIATISCTGLTSPNSTLNFNAKTLCNIAGFTSRINDLPISFNNCRINEINAIDANSIACYDVFANALLQSPSFISTSASTLFNKPMFLEGAGSTAALRLFCTESTGNQWRILSQEIGSLSFYNETTNIESILCDNTGNVSIKDTISSVNVITQTATITPGGSLNTNTIKAALPGTDIEFKNFSGTLVANIDNNGNFNTQGSYSIYGISFLDSSRNLTANDVTIKKYWMICWKNANSAMTAVGDVSYVMYDGENMTFNTPSILINKNGLYSISATTGVFTNNNTINNRCTIEIYVTLPGSVNYTLARHVFNCATGITFSSGGTMSVACMYLLSGSTVKVRVSDIANGTLNFSSQSDWFSCRLIV
jgi:hypothetical protein